MRAALLLRTATTRHLRLVEAALLSMSASNALTVELLRAAGIGELQKVIKWLREKLSARRGRRTSKPVGVRVGVSRTVSTGGR